MTDTTVGSAEAVPPQSGEQQPSADLVVQQRIREALARVEAGKASFGDVLAAAIGEETERVTVLAAPAPTKITDAQRILLARLPEVFGQVNPDTVRKLDQSEIDALSDERLTIDGLLNLLTTRKTEGIREIVANHFDMVVAAEGRDAGTAKDEKGHYLTKESQQTAHAHKFTRETRETKPTLTGDALLAAYERGDLTREEYLSCTREVRVFDETKTRAAIKKNPFLLIKLRPAMVKGGLTASIYHRPSRG